MTNYPSTATCRYSYRTSIASGMTGQHGNDHVSIWTSSRRRLFDCASDSEVGIIPFAGNLRLATPGNGVSKEVETGWMTISLHRFFRSCLVFAAPGSVSYLHLPPSLLCLQNRLSLASRSHLSLLEVDFWKNRLGEGVRPGKFLFRVERADSQLLTERVIFWKTA
jgi:hypothetical protein